MLAESEKAGIGTPAEQLDKGVIVKQINRFDRLLEEAKVGNLTGSQKDALVKREKELIDFFRIGLPTRYEMDHPAKCPGAVMKHRKWELRTKKFIPEWRNLQRLLRPGEEIHIEQLREDGSRSKYV